MISQTAEYALRAVVHLASIGGGPAVTEDIAAVTRVPAGYLSKILRLLAKAGLLTGRRGIGGGFALDRPAGQITVLEVLQACDAGLERITSCPLGIGSHGGQLCAMHRMLDDAIARVDQVFRTATIQDILTTASASRPLCQDDASVQLRIEPKEPDDPPVG